MNAALLGVIQSLVPSSVTAFNGRVFGTEINDFSAYLVDVGPTTGHWTDSYQWDTTTFG